MINFIIDCIPYVAIWCFGCAILNCLQMAIMSSANKSLKIKLPKSKKYRTKDTPIYEVFKTSDGEYAVRKWELDWDWDFNILNVFLFPILIEWYVWRYVERMEFFLCESKDQLENYTEDQIQTIWEDRYKECMDEHKEWESERNQETNNLNRLNAKFNRNWI